MIKLDNIDTASLRAMAFRARTQAVSHFIQAEIAVRAARVETLAIMLDSPAVQDVLAECYASVVTSREAGRRIEL